MISLRKVGLVGIGLALGLMLASCGYGDGDGSDVTSAPNLTSNADKIKNAALGDVLLLDGEEYVVVYDDFNTQKSADSRSISFDAISDAYQKWLSYPSSEKIVEMERMLLQNHLFIPKEKIIFRTVTRKTGDEERNGASKLYDAYEIFDINGKAIASFKVKWHSDNLGFTGTVEQKAAMFDALTEDEIRSYWPIMFGLENRGYETLDKKVYLNVNFKRDRTDPKKADYSEIVEIEDKKGFVKTESGRELPVWREEVSANGDKTFVLLIDGSRFCSVVDHSGNKRSGGYTIYNCGEGTAEGTTSKSVFESSLEIFTLTDSDDVSLCFYRHIYKNNVEDQSFYTKDAYKFSDESLVYHAKNELQKVFGLTFSEETKTINGVNYPVSVTFAIPANGEYVPFQLQWSGHEELILADGDNAPLHRKYGVVTFKCDDNGNYSPDIESWIENYKKDFLLYNK